MPYPITRRDFICANSIAMLAAPLAGQTQPGSGLPSAGNSLETSNAVRTALPPWVRWDERERKQLGEALDQPSLFYWGPGTHNRQTALFIERFKRYCPSQYVQTCSSGTAALHIAIAASGIGPGDEVITTPITDIGTVTGILFQQGVPVFADLEPHSYNLDPRSVERCITPRTKAIVAVHLTGSPCNLDALKALADKHRLVLIEDCAQAWGAKYQGKTVGSIGHVACYSMMDSKHIGTGDGGVVASSDPGIGPALLKFGDKGADRQNRDWSWGRTSVLATNYRMSELQAAFGAAQLERVEGIAAKRAALGKILSDTISDLPGVVPPKPEPDSRSVYWFYFLRLQPQRLKGNRTEFVNSLKAKGVRANAGYIACPIYKLPYFQEHSFFAGRWPVKELGLTQMDYTRVKCPEAEAILETGVTCVLNESMNEIYIREVGAAIRTTAKEFSL